MQIVYEHCCGLDVHKKKIVACLLVVDKQQVRRELLWHDLSGTQALRSLAAGGRLWHGGNGKYWGLLAARV